AAAAAAVSASSAAARIGRAGDAPLHDLGVLDLEGELLGDGIGEVVAAFVELAGEVGDRVAHDVDVGLGSADVDEGDELAGGDRLGVDHAGELVGVAEGER